MKRMKKIKLNKIGGVCMVKIKQRRANRNNYGLSRNVKNIKYIVIHYTANDGDSDESNGNYFATRIIKASAHYFVDDDSITQSVPDNYVAYSVGGSKYTSCSITAPLLCLFPIEVANTIGDITNKNKNSICLLANIIPQKNNEYKKNPPTIIAIIQLMEYL